MTSTTVVDLAVKPEVLTYGVIALQIPDGKDANDQPKFKTELKVASREKEITKAKEDGTLLFEQTVSYDKAGTVEGILQVIKDPEEALSIFNAGLKVKLNQKSVALLGEVDEEGNPTFQPQEGSYDMRDLLNEPAQRRSLSPADKALRTLKGIGLSDEALAAIMAQIRGAL